MFRKNKFSNIPKYDFIFIQGTLPLSRPTGGDTIVFNLIKFCIENDKKIAIIFLKDWKKHPIISKSQSIFSQKNVEPQPYFHFVRKIFRSVYYTKIGFKLAFPIVKKFRKIEYNFDFLKYTDYLIVNSLTKVTMEVKSAIATSWPTAFYLNDVSQNYDCYYLIQNEESDPSFSGKYSELAKYTYTLNCLKKLIVNRHLKDKIGDQNSLIFRIGYDDKKFKILKKIEDRDKRAILIPLMKQEYKGSKYALEAISKLMRAFPDINIYSFGNYRRSEIPKYVTYFESPDTEKLVELYNSAIIFALPSIVEGMSLITLEAMATGCAIVSTRNDGVCEYLSDDFNSVLINAKDSESLYIAIRDLLLDPVRRERLVKNSLETVKEFTQSSLYKSFIDVFND